MANTGRRPDRDGGDSVIGALGSTMIVQITQLAEELPKYQTNLRAKVRALSGAPLASGALDRASGHVARIAGGDHKAWTMLRCRDI